ncbi:hypothetical protein N356_gp092 [Cellulophaga phage phi14:2]|uniref:Uncharacterized protein n=1 Tax=Cellulophaga phage phi14:2 TaxID=1327990 RepID=S0A091_9CAUD|nr:hypothetical protein N356_gp092 [Cellulophaga phage phi14:2]AGO48984.1 hypothetical protein Phi14:2_gp106 [Cellulophaga phage phi14:2]
MDSIVRNFNTNDNFWETNPSFLTVAIFQKFNSEDKSKGKSKSSQIMWAIAFLLDPHQDNIWRNLSDEDKRLLIVEDYLKIKDFKWNDYQELIDSYYSRCLTVPEKDYLELIDKMTERKNFIKNTPYTLDSYEIDERSGRPKLIKGNAKDLDKMVVDTVKLYEQLEVVKEKLEKSKHQDGETKGGMQESATEKGLL